MKRLLPCLIFGLLACSAIVVWTKHDHPHKLSILAIFQNEDRFLKEWIDFHRTVGVEHFYLYNNLSSDKYIEVLQPYVAAGIVELYDWPYESQWGSEADWTKIQAAAYRHGLALASGQTKWLAILDTDEFLVPKQALSLTDWLKDYESCSGILVNWQVFGTSNVQRIPKSAYLIEKLLQQAPVDDEMNTYCKSIVRPESVKYCTDPHTVVYYPWSYSVDPDKNLFLWKFHHARPVKADIICIHHYWSRDEDFFYERKLARYEKWGDNKREAACIKRNQVANQIRNTDILQFIPRLQELQKTDAISLR